MASSVDYLNYVLDLVRKIDNITYKKMMGEYILYQDGIIFGGIYDNRFLIKKTKSIIDYNFDEEIPYKNAKPMYLMDSEDTDFIKEIVILVINDLK